MSNTASLVIKADSSQLQKVLKVMDAVQKEAKQLESATSKLTKSIDKLGDESKQTASQLDKVDKAASKGGKSFGGMSKGALAGGVALAAVAAAGIAFVAIGKKVIENTIKQQDAQEQLKATMKSMGTFTEAAYQANLDYASSLQRVSTFGDEAIISMLSVLGTFGNIAITTPRATQAILDMSTKLGTNLKEGAIQVGKALNDPTKGISALTRVGITFTDEQKKVIKSLQDTGDMAGAQGVILEELERQFAGSALAARNTLGGALKALSNSWNDLFEASDEGATGLTVAINELVTELESKEVQEAFEVITSLVIGAFADLARFTAESVHNIRQFVDAVDGVQDVKSIGDVQVETETAEGAIKRLDNQIKAVQDRASERLKTPSFTEWEYYANLGRVALKSLNDEIDYSEAKGKAWLEFKKEITDPDRQIKSDWSEEYDLEQQKKFFEDTIEFNKLTLAIVEKLTIAREKLFGKPPVPLVELDGGQLSKLVSLTDQIEAKTKAMQDEAAAAKEGKQALYEYNLEQLQASAFKKLSIDTGKEYAELSQKEIDRLKAATKAQYDAKLEIVAGNKARIAGIAANKTLTQQYDTYTASISQSNAASVTYRDTIDDLKASEDALRATQQEGVALGELTYEQELKLAELRSAADAALQLRIEKIKEEQALIANAPTQPEMVLSDVQAEIDALGMSEEMQAKMAAIRDAGANATDREKEAIAAKIEELYAEIEVQQLQNDLQDSFTSNAANALTGFIDGTKSAKEAFRDFALAMLRDISQIIIRLLIMKAIQAALGGGTGAIVAGSGGQSPQQFYRPPGSATGGGISGNNIREVNEMGRPEMLNMGGKQYLLPTGQSGSISPNAGGNNTVNVTIDARGSDDPGKIMALVPIIEERVVKTIEIKQARGF
jgi:hypothetical protein